MLRAASWLYRQSTASEITATLRGQGYLRHCVVRLLVWRNDDEYLFRRGAGARGERLTRAVCQARY